MMGARLAKPADHLDPDRGAGAGFAIRVARVSPLMISGNPADPS
jgi:hypothetical protein